LRLRSSVNIDLSSIEMRALAVLDAVAAQ
jgi:hypothetical protein